ncbi:MAG: hypothetical protein LBL99_02750 [Holosporaceae bacterium]|jgi:hypothetical protein|nr:hypothetical protein [Holosporaceae bacterium]
MRKLLLCVAGLSSLAIMAVEMKPLSEDNVGCRSSVLNVEYKDCSAISALILGLIYDMRTIDRRYRTNPEFDKAELIEHIRGVTTLSEDQIESSLSLFDRFFEFLRDDERVPDFYRSER